MNNDAGTTSETPDTGNQFNGADLISSYSRAQALEDGVLVDVTPWATEGGPDGVLKGCGFLNPVAMTLALWTDLENVPKTERCAGQSLRGRAHDVIFVGSLALRCKVARMTEAEQAHGEVDLCFSILLDRVGTRKRVVVLRLNLGPGDDGRGAVTIGYPEDF